MLKHNVTQASDDGTPFWEILWISFYEFSLLVLSKLGAILLDVLLTGLRESIIEVVIPK